MKTKGATKIKVVLTILLAIAAFAASQSISMRADTGGAHPMQSQSHRLRQGSRYSQEPSQAGSKAPRSKGRPDRDEPHSPQRPMAGHVSPQGAAPNLCNGDCVNRSSPFDPPMATDSTFVVDCDTGLDTGCTFRSGGPLIFSIDVCRVVGDLQKLKDSGLIGPTAHLDLPAFDVDFFADVQPPDFPERDRVFFNGHVMSEFPGNSEFLTGDNDIWKLNSFEIPIEWINFPADPGENGIVTPAQNTIEIDIDVANTDELWCTSVDWAALTLDVARPVVFVHGILRDFFGTDPWNNSPFSWETQMEELGLPFSARLDMGDLDSIGNNAAKIAAEVSSDLQRWGVDKVNLVCHSKGGIDSREYAESSDSVDQLMQIATPNAGSPLADYLEGLLIFAKVAEPELPDINELAGPAGLQLTRPYMALYNAFHGHNSKVTYTAIAGDYDADCTLTSCKHPLNEFLLLLTGEGDTIVPVSSVYALNFTNDLPAHTSVGDDESATHSGLTGSSAVYDELFGNISDFGEDQRVRPAAKAFKKPASSAPPEMARTATLMNSISQGQTQTQTIQIERTGSATFTLLFPSGSLEMALVSPSGKKFDSTMVVKGVDHEKESILGGIMEMFSFSSAEAGAWTVQISAPSVTDPSGSVTYALTAWLPEPAITFIGGFAQENIHVGDDLRILGTLTNNGAALTGASVTAMVGAPDGTTHTVTLHDDGQNGDQKANDGVYTGDLVAANQSGMYRVRFDASGSTGSPFTRETFAVATASASTSSFAGIYLASGEDTDFDGLFNDLLLKAAVNVTTAANYRVYARLTDTQGNIHEASTNTALNSGFNLVPLRFDGSSFFNDRVDGPYTLATIALAEDDSGGVLPLDVQTNAFQTQPFSFRDFQHGSLVLPGTGSAAGVDTDGDGLFDQLTVNVDVEVADAGEYQWSARLTDSTGKEIGFSSNDGLFDAGTNSMSFTFDGQQIGANGLDGPYFVRSLLLFGPTDSLVALNAFTTPAFSVFDFAGSFDVLLQDDTSGDTLKLNSTNGHYQFTDCQKGFSISGTATLTMKGCKLKIVDAGPDPSHPDRKVSVKVNECTNTAKGTLKFSAQPVTFTIKDSDTTNNSPHCP